MKLLKVDTLIEAREKIFKKACSWTLKSETISLNSENLGRILAEDIFASDDIPGFRRAIVDGYAVHSGDTSGATESIPVFLKLAGKVPMGKPVQFSVRSGECAYVPTGAMLPPGADAVVMTEYAELSDDKVALYETAAPGAGMAEAGEDARKGDLLLGSGAIIRPREAALLSAAGVTEFSVFSPLALSVISTGDELVPPEKNPGPGEIRDSNSNALEALAVKRGYRLVSSRLLGDDAGLLEAAIRETSALSDVVLVSGGSSQGEKDFTADIINRVTKGGVFTHGLALKPGKPAILGWDEENRTLLAGLPGHPVAAMMVFELLLGWLFDRLFKVSPPFPIPARITSNIPGKPGRTVLQPVTLRFENGTYLAEPVFGKSGMITTLTRASGYILIDLNKEGLRKDEPVLVHLFQ